MPPNSLHETPPTQLVINNIVLIIIMLLLLLLLILINIYFITVVDKCHKTTGTRQPEQAAMMGSTVQQNTKKLQLWNNQRMQI